jgi:hypothetical protein
VREILLSSYALIAPRRLAERLEPGINFPAFARAPVESETAILQTLYTLSLE